MTINSTANTGSPQAENTAQEQADASGAAAQNGHKGFVPGKSGNPKSRPKGSKNKVTLLAQKLLDGEAESLTRKCIELALDGNLTAL